jgi:hypothetical protein
MTSREQQRAQVLNRLLVGDVTAAEAAILLGLSERQVFRLRAGYQRDGPAALVHGNRGRPSPTTGAWACDRGPVPGNSPRSGMDGPLSAQDARPPGGDARGRCRGARRW